MISRLDKKYRLLNYFTPEEKCSVKYRDLDYVVKTCIKLGLTGLIFYSKTDIKSAFRLVPLNRKSYCWLVLKAKHPITGVTSYFFDKCLPFGASISCSHFQRFSEALRHIFEHKMGQQMILTNYLDDFLFVQMSEKCCNELVRNFLKLAGELGVPIAQEKTEWASTQVVFLGILLDGLKHQMVIPEVKRQRAENWLKLLSSKKKATIENLQSLAGLLNFLNKAIIPGRVFTRRMYAKFSQHKYQNLWKFHHVTLDREFKEDCLMWLEFLKSDYRDIVSRPFLDFLGESVAVDIEFTSDTLANVKLGYGAVYRKSWLFGQWPQGFITEKKPSIEFLELYALCMGIFTWIDSFRNKSVVIYCDNTSVMNMVNYTTSGCKFCMILIRKLTLLCLIKNVKLFVRYIWSKDNSLSDSLSRLNFREFYRLTKDKGFDTYPTFLDIEIWPVDKLWRECCKAL